MEPQPAEEPDYTAAEAFDHIFWPAYPRKVAKKAAKKAWNALNLKDDDQLRLDAIMSGLERAKQAWNDVRFIPHPASWLNGARWEDE